jgi:hypothetical protein
VTDPSATGDWNSIEKRSRGRLNMDTYSTDP